ncbi:sigma-70 family RNA polymerase sigma factor [Cyanobacteria bacterium FACHB-63]|nr:sigma-70 family RNA polymerase sigma factor [Cyanobacteria bacterium FACHB-63]
MNSLSKQSGESPMEAPSDPSARSRLCQQLFANLEQRRRIEQIARKHTRGTTIPWEDAAQEAYLKVLQVAKAGKFRSGSTDDFYRWAVTVARFEIIDLVRHHKRQYCISLDQTLPDTELSLIETIADEFDAFGTLERSNLVLEAIRAIVELDRRYPDRGYLKLWQGRVAGKTQVQLAVELGVMHQGAVSKRWKELVQGVSQALLLEPEAMIKGLKPVPEAGKKRRSQQQW